MLQIGSCVLVKVWLISWTNIMNIFSKEDTLIWEWYHLQCGNFERFAIIFCVELVERKDWPKQLGPKEIDDFGKFGINAQNESEFVELLQSCNFDKVVVIKSSFSVSNGILAIREMEDFERLWLIPKEGNSQY